MNKYVSAAAIAVLGFPFLTAGDTYAETTECMEVTSLPAVITKQGIHCFKRNLATAITTGNAIEIAANNVTIDLNGFKLGGNAAGPTTTTKGIFAEERKNIIIRNGTIRGFNVGVSLEIASGSSINSSSGHVVEDTVFDGNTVTGVQVIGTGSIIRNNRVVNTGPGDTSTISAGLLLVGQGNVISGNLITNTDETDEVYGIYVATSDRIRVFDNTVFDTGGPTTGTGILAVNVNDMHLHENTIVNSSGVRGISITGTSSGIGCVGNYVSGFTFAEEGCGYKSGNHFN